MKSKRLAVCVLAAWGVYSASATTFLYDLPYGDNPSPDGNAPWMTLDLDGSVFTFTIPGTTASLLETVYFNVLNPEQITVTSDFATKGDGLDGYNLAFDFDGITPGAAVYTVELAGWDGTLLRPVGGTYDYYSIVAFADGSWAADMPWPAPEGGLTVVMLAIGLLGLWRVRRAPR